MSDRGVYRMYKKNLLFTVENKLLCFISYFLTLYFVVNFRNYIFVCDNPRKENMLLMLWGVVLSAVNYIITPITKYLGGYITSYFLWTLKKGVKLHLLWFLRLQWRPEFFFILGSRKRLKTRSAVFNAQISWQTYLSTEEASLLKAF